VLPERALGRVLLPLGVRLGDDFQFVDIEQLRNAGGGVVVDYPLLSLVVSRKSRPAQSKRAREFGVCFCL